MILLIDIGNTLTKIALGDESNNKLSFIKAIDTQNHNWEKTMQKISLSKKTKVENVVICSVVPKKLPIISKIITTIFKFKPIILNYNTIKFLPIKVDAKYTEIGSDLIALSIASHHLFDSAITISLGTATTYCIIKDSILKGVVIGPGFTSAKLSLSNAAAQIKPFQVAKYQSVLGNSTKHALSIGYGNGFNYMIDDTIKVINKELKTNLKVIVTGGSFEELKPFLTFKYQYQDNLVLQGLIIIYQILKKNNKLK
ncbi:type III pantothenate kinase [Spiroplasma platyhelix]|uniref:Type III pantothenate kinase n=1 Tax=Spiroplasma platyhelix PALS-1 TaxID=1276218 RepID=A0A846UCD3_9MOLU|nr:type III pantothenate kinase [Spiroplasma platyhelix]MBE4703815.1 Type III pantothenate kinase [Spiroplasma platyhelix PALS-1]NKE38188.1 type III pantothenate kinase [Spiroplasma platyhelix PALS-1]UJB29073.1 type III pantothenate kinase [Spiroplasma platyhelix PALS-1]